MVKTTNETNGETKKQGFTNEGECAIMIHGSEEAMVERDGRKSSATNCNEGCLNEVKGVREMKDKVKEADERIQEVIIAVSEIERLLEEDGAGWDKEINELRVIQRKLVKVYVSIHSEAQWRELARNHNVWG
jgi:hypothetical protein